MMPPNHAWGCLWTTCGRFAWVGWQVSLRVLAACILIHGSVFLLISLFTTTACVQFWNVMVFHHIGPCDRHQLDVHQPPGLSGMLCFPDTLSVMLGQWVIFATFGAWPLTVPAQPPSSEHSLEEMQPERADHAMGGIVNMESLPRRDAPGSSLSLLRVWMRSKPAEACPLHFCFYLPNPEVSSLMTRH